MAEIVHIALVKLDADHDDALARDHVVEYARRVLPTVPGVERFVVGRALPEVVALTAQAQAHTHAHSHAPPVDREWDLVFEFHFATHAAHERFRVDPDRLAFFDQFLGPQTAAVKAWSFQVLEDPDAT